MKPAERAFAIAALMRNHYQGHVQKTYFADARCRNSSSCCRNCDGAELSSAQAALAKAHAVLEQAQKHAKRIEKLAEGRVASQAQYDNGMAALRQAQQASLVRVATGLCAHIFTRR